MAVKYSHDYPFPTNFTIFEGDDGSLYYQENKNIWFAAQTGRWGEDESTFATWIFMTVNGVTTVLGKASKARGDFYIALKKLWFIGNEPINGKIIKKVYLIEEYIP